MSQSAAISAFPIERSATQHVREIPPLARSEVMPQARVELDRFLALVEHLSPDDLQQRTDCALWSVKDIVAHQASHVTGLVSVGECLNQFNPRNYREYTAKGMNTLDAANQRQVDMRADRTLAELIAEMRENAEPSFAGRQRFPFFLRWVRMPVPGFDGRISIGYLIDTIYTRDMWMHRVDIARVTGREMVLTPEHDGRIVALIVREVDGRLGKALGTTSVTLRLTGPAGGEWIAGGANAPSALLEFDLVEFNRLASGRTTAQHVLDHGLVRIDGERAAAETALRNIVVLY
ncbi:MAG: maleylpyruvate isomerase family mycothiol-dependent enzyme [Chloroflexi bacterium]|nr:maleylpyruvate isomerase family mycothiol-dependent enzyme [Chloroflexota bacterium]